MSPGIWYGGMGFAPLHAVLWPSSALARRGKRRAPCVEYHQVQSSCLIDQQHSWYWFGGLVYTSACSALAVISSGGMREAASLGSGYSSSSVSMPSLFLLCRWCLVCWMGFVLCLQHLAVISSGATREAVGSGSVMPPDLHHLSCGCWYVEPCLCMWYVCASCMQCSGRHQLWGDADCDELLVSSTHQVQSLRVPA
jgi:hypothetical protein